MKTHHTKYIILGAGLSGLSTGHALAKAGESDFILLESRDRIGGRILTTNGIDLGATWFQNHHDTVHYMVDTLRLQKFYQWSQGRGVLVYDAKKPAHYFESDPSTPAAFRIVGGTSALVNGLGDYISENIKVSTVASEILKIENGLRVMTNAGIFEAEKVIVTIPPKIASRLVYDPALPASVISAMDTTHTWMSNAIKVGMTFSKPFWREQGLSGTVIGQMNPLTELYDHSGSDDKTYGLMGFVNEHMRDLSAVKRKEVILDYLSIYLGAAVREFLRYEEKDWSADRHTSSDPLQGGYTSPRYGRSEFQSWYLDDRLLFSGAETATMNGGYMDGALRSGLQAAAQLLQVGKRS
jgi:monoamine oxidase